MDLAKLKPGITIILVLDGAGVDKLYVLDLKEEGLNGDKEIKLKSLTLHPDEEFTFCLFRDGWSLIGSDPMTGNPCYASSGPFYSFESALHTNWIDWKLSA
ncbi:MAG: hypothetical protein ACOYL8_03800 [Patescibacteria group bacterium]